jgi:hypothetical protein
VAPQPLLLLVALPLLPHPDDGFESIGGNETCGNISGTISTSGLSRDGEVVYSSCFCSDMREKGIRAEAGAAHTHLSPGIHLRHVCSAPRPI